MLIIHVCLIHKYVKIFSPNRFVMLIYVRIRIVSQTKLVVTDNKAIKKYI